MPLASRNEFERIPSSRNTILRKYISLNSVLSVLYRCLYMVFKSRCNTTQQTAPVISTTSLSALKGSSIICERRFPGADDKTLKNNRVHHLRRAGDCDLLKA